MARLALFGIMLALSTATPSRAQSDEREDFNGCETYRITGYVRGHGSGRTYDGTSVWTSEAIAAASWNVPIGARVQVENLGTFRVADRGGGLSSRHIDVLVDSAAEAYALTGSRRVCVL